MWVLYPDRHFEEQDSRLLTTLGAQAAVVYENSRLLTEAQSERGRLRAILASTSDPLLVADQEGRLVLTNPAAERVLGLEGALNKRVSARDTVRDPSLRMLLHMPLRQSCITRELHLDSGITLSAAVSPIALDDGGNGAGHSHARRDRAQATERAQADFVANLSRDIRTPLTFLRGYANMIPRVGDINPQQQDFVDRILRNVDLVSGMLDSLVDLNTIELGEGPAERCSVAGAIEAALAS